MYSEVGMYRNEKCNFLKKYLAPLCHSKMRSMTVEQKKQHELTSHATEQGQDILGIS